MENTKSFTSGGVLSSLIKFAIPVLVAMFLQSLYGAVDLLVVGRFAETIDVSGVATGSLLMQTVTMIITGLSMGVTVYVGQKIGEKKEEEAADDDGGKLNYKELFLLAIATSIDALAVGVTFAFLNVNIILAACLIAIITFIISCIGVKLGNVFGDKYEKKAELAGGVVLVLIGLKILLEHLGILVL